MNNDHRKNRRGESGTSLILGTASLSFLIPMIGLAVDSGFLYAAKSRLQASVDGASLAAARALNMGATLQSQQLTAAQNAVNWFYANFPLSTWNSTGTVMTISGYTNFATGFSSASVNIFPDATNPQLDHVNVTASTNLPTWFMRWFGYTTLNISATGNATRRSVVMMMVLDRSGSMCTVGGVTNQPCSNANTTTPCAQMITAAKQFTGSFRPWPGLHWPDNIQCGRVCPYGADDKFSKRPGLLEFQRHGNRGPGHHHVLPRAPTPRRACPWPARLGATRRDCPARSTSSFWRPTACRTRSPSISGTTPTASPASPVAAPARTSTGRTMSSNPKGFQTASVIPVSGQERLARAQLRARQPFLTTCGVYSAIVPTGMIGPVAVRRSGGQREQ